MTAPVSDWSDVNEAAKQLAGNHRSFHCFAWFDEPDDSENWAIIYTHHRDSGILDQSNGAVIHDALEPFTEGEAPDVVSERHNHWAVGWIDGFALRVFDKEGRVTPAFRTYCELRQRMESYPLLDEEDYSRREYESALEAIESQGRRLVRDDAPDDWAGQVFSWLWDNNQTELENTDDQGAYPSEEAVEEALAELGLLPAVTWEVVVGNVGTITSNADEDFARRQFAYYVQLSKDGVGTSGGEAVTLFCDGEIEDEHVP